MPQTVSSVSTGNQLCYEPLFIHRSYPTNDVSPSCCWPHPPRKSSPQCETCHEHYGLLQVHTHTHCPYSILSIPLYYSVRLAVFLRRYPYARLFLIFYMVYTP
jgi:hypothetical protein